MSRVRRFGLIVLVFLLFSIPTQAQSSNPINHIIVIYQENWSFDSLYGTFPGANGLSNAGATIKQADKNGQLLTTLPQPIDTNLKPPGPDSRFPANRPVQPFSVAQYVPADQKIGDLVHRFYQEQYQIDGGKMDKFVTWSDNGGLTLGHYDATNMPEGQLAQQYTMADNFFHAAYGGSFLNHFWLICACSPKWPNAPASRIAQLDANGVMVKDGSVTPDGYVVNTSYTINSPHPPNITDTAQLVPEQTMPTIGDRLSEKSISWAWFSGGWTDALNGQPDPLFQYHHQPFAFFQNYADGTDGRKQHLKDESEFHYEVQTNTLPAVSFIKALGPNNEHPGYADLLKGQQHVVELVQEVQNSPAWSDTAIIITYDENGGFWDHVAPPQRDQWGDGTRVPAIIISPYAKKHFVDHTQYDTTSILKFIENRYGLAPLGTRDASANDLTNAFNFNQQPGGRANQPATLPNTGGSSGSLSGLIVVLALLICAGGVFRRMARL